MAKKRRKKRSKGASKQKRAKRRVRRSKRRSKRGRVIVLKRKGSSVRVKRNPQLGKMLADYTGLDMKEAGALLVGGALYGTVNSLAGKYVPQAYTLAAKIPVVGTTAVPFLIGVAIKWAGAKAKVKALEMLGEGVVGAAVVGMGINAAQYIPGLASVAGYPQYSGVDFTPNMSGYANSQSDFGRDPGNPDFGAGQGYMNGVDFTPNMGSAQLGEIPRGLGYAGEAQMGRDPGNPDFGEIPQGLA